MNCFNFNKWGNKNVVIHCKTKEEARDFCRVMYENGLWTFSENYLKCDQWDKYNKNTCYNFNSGRFGYVNFYSENGYTILEWSDYMEKEFTKQDLKNGDVCVYRSGYVAIAIPEVGIFREKNGFDYMEKYFDNLKSKSASIMDIIKVYRPKVGFQCGWDERFFTEGELVYDREKFKPVEVTIEEIAELKGVSVDRIKIVKNKNK